MPNSANRRPPFRRLAAVLTGLALCASALAAQSSEPGPLYKEALSREAALRTDLEAHEPGAQAGELLRRLRIMIGAYDDLARLFPTSGYSDNALWQGGMLAADTFFAFGEEAELMTALRMLRAVPERFPTSSLNAQIPDQIARLERVDPAAVAARIVAATGKTAGPPDRPAAATARAAEGPARSTAAPAKAAGAPARPAAVPAASSSPARPQPSTPAAGAPAASSSSSLVALHRVTREVLPDVLRITLTLEREVTFYQEQIVGQPRIYLDLRYTRPVQALREAAIPYNDDAVRQVRIGEHPDRRTRVVLDLATADQPYSVYTLYNPFRIVIDFERMRDRRSLGSRFQVPNSGFGFRVPGSGSGFGGVGFAFRARAAAAAVHSALTDALGVSLGVRRVQVVQQAADFQERFLGPAGVGAACFFSNQPPVDGVEQVVLTFDDRGPSHLDEAGKVHRVEAAETFGDLAGG